HSHENDYLTWIGTRSKDGFAIQKHVLRKHGAWLYRNMFPSRLENTSLVASAGTTLTGLASDWTYAFGRKGFLLEMQQGLSFLNRRNTRRAGANALKWLIHENWKIESE